MVHTNGSAVFEKRRGVEWRGVILIVCYDMIASTIFTSCKEYKSLSKHTQSNESWRVNALTDYLPLPLLGGHGEQLSIAGLSSFANSGTTLDCCLPFPSIVHVQLQVLIGSHLHCMHCV